MAIEFRCPDCQQLLRVGDDAVGRNARCPQCNSVVPVPAAAPTTDSPPVPAPTPQQPQAPQWPFAEGEPILPNKPAIGFATAGASPNPYAPSAAAFQPTMPGAFHSGPINPQRIGVGPIFNHAWRVWQANLGLLAGVTLVYLAITLPVDLGSQVAAEMLRQQGEQRAGNQVELIGWLLSNILELYLGIGQAQIALKLARGLPAQFSDLFGGGSRFLPVLGASLLAGIGLSVGIVLCIVPAIIFALMFWPFYYLVVERKAGVMDSFGIANEITQGNWGTAFLLLLLSIVIVVVGLLALCVGIVVALPLISLVWATAYLMMSGQLAPFPFYAPAAPPATPFQP